MRNILKITAAATAVVAFSGSAALAQVSADGDASITIQEALTITAVDDLLFGTVVAPATGDGSLAVTVDPAAPTGDQQAGTFDLTGEEGEAVNINLPADGVVDLTRDGGVETIPVTAFSSDQAGETLTLTAGGDTIAIGATATVAEEQVAGLYEGTYTVEVEYAP